MEFPIRRAEVTDAGQIAECLRELGYGSDSLLVQEKLSAFANSLADTVLVACCGDGGVGGVVSVHLLPLFHAPGTLARVTALAVRADHQRRGIGRRLLLAAEQFTWAADCQRVEITSGDHRPAAHRFYEANGYQENERRFLKSRR